MQPYREPGPYRTCIAVNQVRREGQANRKERQHNYHPAKNLKIITQMHSISYRLMNLMHKFEYYMAFFLLEYQIFSIKNNTFRHFVSKPNTNEVSSSLTTHTEPLHLVKNRFLILYLSEKGASFTGYMVCACIILICSPWPLNKEGSNKSNLYLF